MRKSLKAVWLRKCMRIVALVAVAGMLSQCQTTSPSQGKGALFLRSEPTKVHARDIEVVSEPQGGSERGSRTRAVKEVYGISPETTVEQWARESFVPEKGCDEGTFRITIKEVSLSEKAFPKGTWLEGCFKDEIHSSYKGKVVLCFQFKGLRRTAAKGITLAASSERYIKKSHSFEERQRIVTELVEEILNQLTQSVSTYGIGSLEAQGKGLREESHTTEGRGPSLRWEKKIPRPSLRKTSY